MKILVIGQTYCEWNSRAKWRSLIELYPKIEIKVITPFYWPDVLSRVESKSEVIQEGSKKKLSVVPSKAFFLGHEIYHFYPGLSKIIRSFKPDLIQVETGSNSLALFQTILIKKFLRLKTKIVFFSWVNWIPKSGWKYKYFYSWIEQFNLRNSDGAILGNKDAQTLTIQNKKFKKTTMVVPLLGTDTQIFYRTEDKKIFKQMFGLDEHKIIIGFAGRLVTEKGVGLLIDAFASMKSCLDKDLYKNIHLVIAGAGEEEDELKAHVKRSNLDDKVTFLGSLQHKQMPDFFKAIDIFVLPSFDTLEWKEQFGQVLVQAMMSGVPVIGSDGGEIPNVISDAGLVFKQKNMSDLTEKLKKIVSSESLRKEFATKGLIRAELNYSHESIAKQTYNFWNQLLQE